MTRVYRLALAAVVASLAVVLLGGIARLLPPGSGCGNDWPQCDGRWLPGFAPAPMVEYGHRLAVVGVVALTVLTALLAVREHMASTRVRRFAAASVGMILVQSGIGAFVAVWGAPPAAAILHLTAAMLFLALVVLTLAAVAADRGAPGWLGELAGGFSPARDRIFAGIATAGAALALTLVVFGAATSESGAFACATWPLCAGVEDGVSVHLGYRATALIGTLAAAGVAITGWRRAASPTARRLAMIAVLLVSMQTAIAAGASLIGSPAWISAVHLPVAMIFWIAMASVAAVSWGPRSAARTTLEFAPNSGARMGQSLPGLTPLALATEVGASVPVSPAFAPPLWTTLQRLHMVAADYVALTKPGIMSLLLTTTFCAMLIAERGVPPFWLIAVTLLGGVLASGGANVLNCFIDRDIDREMSRTRHRASAAGRISPAATLVFGLSLTVAAVLLLGWAVNWMAALLALAGNLFYVFVYTLWLKRSTPYNIVIGGAAGAVPPLVGWAAVTGELAPLAWGLFAIVFAWTPPHFWALALLKQGEYGRAAVPMLPVVRGEAETRRQIVLYTVMLTIVCLALVPLGLGAVYLVAAVVLNGVFLYLAVRLYMEPSKRIARQTFFFSLWYLAALFAAAVIDRMI